MIFLSDWASLRRPLKPADGWLQLGDERSFTKA